MQTFLIEDECDKVSRNSKNFMRECNRSSVKERKRASDRSEQNNDTPIIRQSGTPANNTNNKDYDAPAGANDPTVRASNARLT